MRRIGSFQAYAAALTMTLALWAVPGSANEAGTPSAACQFGLAETEFQSLAADTPDHLTRQLADLGVPKREARHALAMLKQRAALKDLREASRLVVARQVDPCDRNRVEVISLTLAVENAGDFTVARNDAGKFALVAAEERYVFHLRVNGQIEDGDLAKSLIQAGLPGAVADQVIDSFVADAELPTYRIHQGEFDVVYQVYASAQGAPTEAVLTAAELTVDHRSRRIYYYKPEGASALIVDSDGRPVGPQNQAVMAAAPVAVPAVQAAAVVPASISPQKFIHPLPQGRYTSGYGWRRHPVLGKRKFHNGVDFSAPQGTPVMAAADGVVTIADQHRTYGKRVVLAHAANTETVYAHLHGFAAAVRPGQVVRQGEIIGYVGRSGLASGNHLYFELAVNGRFIDPMGNVPALKSGNMAFAAVAAEPEATLPTDGTVALVTGSDVKRFVAMADALRDSLPVRSTALR